MQSMIHLQPRISLDQWTALVSVVEAGSYAKAGERLHKSQSTLTYAIQKLEDALEVKVFRIDGRKAVLTPIGEVLFRRGKTLVDEAARLERAARELAQGWEPELRLAVEITYPTWLLLRCLEKFSRERPQTRIELLETVLGGNEEALVQSKVHLAIGPVVPTGFVGDPLMPVRFLCLAAPEHPLHQLGRELALDDLRGYRHLVIRDSGVQRVDRGGWLNEQRWTVSHKATSIRAAVMGLGYAWYSEDSAREELDRGTLKPLPLREGAVRISELYLIYAERDAAGPGTRRLAEIVREETKSACRLEAQAP